MDEFTDFTPDRQDKISRPTWKWYFGKSKTFIVYTDNPPNRFQRWMIKIFFGITWEKVK
jgi:hypothetical protein